MSKGKTWEYADEPPSPDHNVWLALVKNLQYLQDQKKMPVFFREWPGEHIDQNTSKENEDMAVTTLSKFMSNWSIGATAVDMGMFSGSHLMRVTLTRNGKELAYVTLSMHSADSCQKTTLFKSWYQDHYISDEVKREFLGDECYQQLCEKRGVAPSKTRSAPIKHKELLPVPAF